MGYKVFMDSCGQLTEAMKANEVFVSIPLTIELDGEIIMDDETFNQAEFLKKVAASPNVPKSSCPSPEEFMQCYQNDAERIYVVTISDQLSGTYNSAVLGKNLYQEEQGDKPVHVFNSYSAVAGQTVVALKVQECEEAGMEFAQVVETVEAYIAEQHTYFVLETLDTVRKSGRLTGIKSVMASALNIKPVMGSTPEGTIQQLGQGRGMRRALGKMVDQIVKDVKNSEEKILAIAHCNCKQRALEVQQMVRERIKIKDSLIVNTAAIGTMYANDGGIVVAL